MLVLLASASIVRMEQCSQYSAQTIDWTIRFLNPDRSKKHMLLQNDHIGSSSYLMSSGNSFSREKSGRGMRLIT